MIFRPDLPDRNGERKAMFKSYECGVSEGTPHSLSGGQKCIPMIMSYRILVLKEGFQVKGETMYETLGNKLNINREPVGLHLLASRPFMPAKPTSTFSDAKSIP